jgi:monoterpene epsilon-lactone hydrolase
MIPHRLPERPSLRAQAFNWTLRFTAKPAIFFFNDHPVALKAFDTLYTTACKALLINHTPRSVRTVTHRLSHCSGEWVMAKGARADKVIYYLHGGAYFLSSPLLHRSITWRLSRSNHRSVFALDYRTAPEASLEDCLADALEGYRFLLASGIKAEDIIIAGDSAGGHLSLLTLQHLHQAGLPQPSAAILISPWTDLACSSASLSTNNWRDPYFWESAIRTMGGYFADQEGARHTLISPVDGDFSGLPPLMIMVGSIEVLRDDARRAAQKASAAGVPVCYEEWRDMPHIFPFFSAYLPEAKRAFRHISSFVHAVDAGKADWYAAEHDRMHHAGATPVRSPVFRNAA